MRLLLTAFFARLRLLMLVPMVCGLVTAGICYQLPSMYSGGFSLLVKAPEIDKASLESDTSVVMRPGVIMENVISDEIYMLESHELYRKVARDLQAQDVRIESYLDKALPQGLKDLVRNTRERVITAGLISPSKASFPVGDDLDHLAGTVEAMSVVEPLTGSDVIRIRINHHDREMIKIILNAYVAAYFELREAVWFNSKAPGFFRDTTDQTYRKWQEVLDQLLSLEEETDLVDAATEKAELMKQLATSTSEILMRQTELADLEAQLKTLQALRPEAAVTFLSDETESDRMFRELKTTIGQVRAERSKLLRDFDTKAPAVLKVDFQLQELSKEYKRMLISLVTMKIERTRNRVEAIATGMAQRKEHLRRLNRLDHQVRMMEEKIELYRKQYASTGEKSMAMQLQEDLRKQVTSVNIVSEPFVDPKATWPQKRFLVMLAVAFGFLLTLFTTVAAQLMRDCFQLPEEITRELNLPVLASFPYQKEMR